jgi:uncharacterized glyoxalase superfamily protein PhnB
MAKGFWPVINVESVAKSVEFYKGLGLKATEEEADMPGAEGLTFGQIDFGDSGIIIWDKHNAPPDQPADTAAWLRGELGKGVMFTLGVADAKKAWAKAQAMRAEVDTPYEAQPWGGGGFTVVDPDGYVVGITDKFPDMSRPKRKSAARSSTRAKRPAAKRRRSS